MWGMLARLLPLTWAEWRHHPWRHGVALLAVALGVALASSVQWINDAALGEFAQAVRAVNGQPDVVIGAAERAGLDAALLDRVAADERVVVASPLLELNLAARSDESTATIKVMGIDALQAGRVAPGLMPIGATSPAALLDPGAAWLNPAARARWPGDTIELLAPSGWRHLRVAGSVAAPGPALAVVDIAAAQALLAGGGTRLSRIDIRLAAGVDAAAWQRGLDLPAGARYAQPDEALQRVSTMSRAYRVNLGVLALVALLVGGFLVYSVVSLSVAQRTPAFALLGVLGLAARDRRRWVLAESALLGALGSAIGLAAGAGLAALALRFLGGDLGGGYFAGVAPALGWPWPMLAACAALGIAAALAGAWWPARQAERLAPALALKGLGHDGIGTAPRWLAALLLALGVACALLPPVDGLPLAAYLSVALLLGGGVAAVPAGVQLLLSRRASPASALALLAWRRARFARQTAGATVAGVVASLALSVALTVMVASFREAVAQWLDTVLPADLYLRGAGGSSLPPAFITGAGALPAVQRIQAQRLRSLSLDARQPDLALLARPLPEPERQLPLLGAMAPARDGEIGVFVSEPAALIHQWTVGDVIALPLAAGAQRVRVRGIWRDYARQFGAVAIDSADYQRLTGDSGVDSLALWLAPRASPADAERALRRLAGDALALDVSSTAQLRQMSLAIFDRSFAVTLYLQAVAIVVGLVGVAASLSAQVLARRKEFGLLAHLGLTRRQVLLLVTLESSAWLAVGCAAGLLLGLAIATVLVQVVNPQSFHWTMPLQLPAARLAALAAAVLLAGAATAAFSARRAASRQAVLAVKEDW